MSPRSRKPHWAAYAPVSARRPAVRRSAVALLVASALTGGYALAAGPITAQLGTVARECDAPQAMRQLAAARQTRSDARALLADLRTTGADDPRATALSREISDLGFTPARYSGWRQKAVDVSDQLHGTTDPGLHKIAVELARHGVGPTPADLLGQEPPPAPGPIADMGESLGQAAGDTLGGAVDAAGDAAKSAAPKPAATGEGQGRSEPKTEKTKQPEPPLPQTCLDNTASPATNSAPQADPPDEQTAVPLPSYSAEPGPDEDTGSDSSSGDGSSGDGSSGDGASGDGASDTADVTSPTGDPSSSEDTGGEGTGSGDTDSASSTGGSGSGSSGDIQDAREAIQLLGELMQALGASG
ncbi:MAG: hypothetical protein L0I76_16695, partial [Pseudonocardia sp.]|nr:hypothetical protein [Pseudonocardia sp.]